LVLRALVSGWINRQKPADSARMPQCCRGAVTQQISGSVTERFSTRVLSTLAEPLLARLICDRQRQPRLVGLFMKTPVARRRQLSPPRFKTPPACFRSAPS
jgi:hypothetical protein